MTKRLARIDLYTLASWVSLPLIDCLSLHHQRQLSPKEKLQLTELLVDFDLNQRMPWTRHDPRYRHESFADILGPIWYQPDFREDFDIVQGMVTEYLSYHHNKLFGKNWSDNRIYGIERVCDYVYIVDLGRVKKHQTKSAPLKAFEFQETEYCVDRKSATEHVVRVRNSNPQVMAMPSINITINVCPSGAIVERPQELTDEQFEWLGQLEELRLAHAKRKAKQLANEPIYIKQGIAIKERFKQRRSVFGPVQPVLYEFGVPEYRMDAESMATAFLDNGEIHRQGACSSGPFRPVRVQRPRRHRHTKSRTGNDDVPRNMDRSHYRTY